MITKSNLYRSARTTTTIRKHVEPVDGKALSAQELEQAKAKAIFFILKHIRGSVRTVVRDRRGPREAWAAIEDYFKDSTGIESALAISRLVNTKEAGDLKEYLTSFERIRRVCMDHGWTEVQDLDHFYAIMMVTNLSSEYAPLRSLLLGKGKTLTFSIARDSITAEADSRAASEAEDSGMQVVDTTATKPCWRCQETGHNA